MVQSEDLVEKLQQTLPRETWLSIAAQIPQECNSSRRRSHKNIHHEINRILVDTAIQQNNCNLLNSIQEISDNEAEQLFSKVSDHFLKTKERCWIEAVFQLSEKLTKKSNQSRIFAKLAHTLINEGVSEGQEQFIENGMTLLQQISFRKYRSEIMIDIIPLLIVWAVTSRNKKFIIISFDLIEEIGDISRKAVLHAELAKALATIAIADRDRESFYQSIHQAAKIHQKHRRHDCLVFIMEKGAKSPLGKEMTEISTFLTHFAEIQDDAYLEIVSALAEQMLDKIKSKEQIQDILNLMGYDKPAIRKILVQDMLRKAERSADLWFLISAMNLQEGLPNTASFPAKDIVRAGISVAKETENMQVLIDLIPILEKNVKSDILSRIFLQFSQIMLDSDDFESALLVFGKIDQNDDLVPRYHETLIQLIKCGISKDRISELETAILVHNNPKIVNAALERGIIDFCKNSTLNDIQGHIRAIITILRNHPSMDAILLDSITILIERDLLNSRDPGILIELADSINNRQIKEKAVSLIVIKIARIGVNIGNRDLLQRAVGLTCEIKGQNTRSTTFGSIIDEATILATRQGDLDLLLRMKTWSSSLLAPDLAIHALANIIDGVIKYAINTESVEALEKAAHIAEEVNDPSLKTQIFERIAEGFINIGCILLNTTPSEIPQNKVPSTLYPFERSLNIIKANSKSQQVSLKIAGFIDVIITYSQSTENPDYAIILAYFATEIDSTYERDAMMSRIISNLRDNLPHSGSTDPYEIMATHLFRNEDGIASPAVREVLYKVINNIREPFIRFSFMCHLADISARRGDHIGAQWLLKQISSAKDEITEPSENVVILADMAAVYSLIDTDIASLCLEQGIALQKTIIHAPSPDIRKRIILSIVRLHAAKPDKKWILLAQDIADTIQDPIEYINSLIAIHSMIQNDPDTSGYLLGVMVSAADRIRSPYDRISTILDLVPLTFKNSDTDIFLELLAKAEDLIVAINIQYIADAFRETIIDFYLVYHAQQPDKEIHDRAIPVIRSIDNDELRIQLLQKIGITEPDVSRYSKIKNLAEKIMQENTAMSNISSLEQNIRAIADRGKESLFFCDLAIFFKRAGNKKLAQRMIQSSIKEARIIRPLSRRSYVLSDIALRLFAAGSDDVAQNILDYAIDSATNIRQTPIRDLVFEELGLAIKIMQGLEE